MSRLSSELVGRSAPLLPCHEADAEPIVAHTEIVVASADDGIRHQFGNLVRQHANILNIAPEVAIVVQGESILETSDQYNIALKPNIRRC